MFPWGIILSHPRCVNEPVQYFNRYTNRIETEQIYGEGPMRWVYETRLGQMALWLLVRRAFFSHWYGWRMRRIGSRGRICPFIEKYGLDAAEFADDLDAFGSFDAFFSRRLRPEARPIDAGLRGVVFPADGRHLGFQNVDEVEAIYAKGQRFDLAALLGGEAAAERYRGGALVCSRLCPVDYHRFHFPVTGMAREARLLNGWLYSVNPVALRRQVKYLWQNKRQCVQIEAGACGVVTLVVIGATNVGSMTFTYPENGYVERGTEAGFFSFGGSFVATLFEPGKIRLAEDLLRETQAGRELYAHMGDLLGTGAESA